MRETAFINQQSVPDWGQLGAAVGAFLAAATGYLAWKSNKGKEPDKDKPLGEGVLSKEDQEIIQNLRQLVGDLQNQNDRLIKENERLWGRVNMLNEMVQKLQDECAGVRRRISAIDHKNGV